MLPKKTYRSFQPVIVDTSLKLVTIVPFVQLSEHPETERTFVQFAPMPRYFSGRVCGERMGFNAFRYCCSSMRLSWSPEALERATTVASVLRFESPLPYLYPRPPAVQFSQSMCIPLYFLPALLLVLSIVGLIIKFAFW